MNRTESELERRRPVWEALSRLFLDTQLDLVDRQRIAETVDASGFSQDEIRVILWEELYPLLRWNLQPVPGEWQGFDVKWIEERILSGASRFTWLMRLWAMMPFGPAAIVRKEWSELEPFLSERIQNDCPEG